MGGQSTREEDSTTPLLDAQETGLNSVMSAATLSKGQSIDSLGSRESERKARDNSSKKRLIFFALAVMILFLCVLVVLLQHVKDVTGYVHNSKINITTSIGDPHEYNDACDTSSRDFTFDNMGDHGFREDFSIASVIVVFFYAFQSVFAILSKPAAPIPAIDQWLADPQCEKDMSMRQCPGNSFVRLGNLVPDAELWPTKVGGKFAKMHKFAMHMAKSMPPEGRRKESELKGHAAVQALLAMPHQVRFTVPFFGTSTINLPWNMRTAKYVFFGQLLFMVISLARMSWCSTPDFKGIVFQKDWAKWVSLAFRREMLFPIIFKIVYVWINFTNVECFFRGGEQIPFKGAFVCVILAATCPLLLVFLPAILVALVPAWLICVIGEVWWNGKYTGLTRQQFIPMASCVCVSSFIVGHMFYHLSEHTYLCTHARIKFWDIHYPLAINPEFVGFALGWGISALGILLCVSILTSVQWVFGVFNMEGCAGLPIPMRAAVDVISNPNIDYETWMVDPMYNLTELRLHQTEYREHCNHFMEVPWASHARVGSQARCRYCEITELNQPCDDDDAKALDGEPLVCKLVGIPLQLLKFERAVKKAWACDPTDLETCAKIRQDLDKRVEDARAVLECSSSSALARRFKTALDKSEKAKSEHQRIFETYTNLETALADLLSLNHTEDYESWAYDKYIGAKDNLAACIDRVKEMRREHANVKFKNFSPDKHRDTKGCHLLEEATKALDEKDVGERQALLGELQECRMQLNVAQAQLRKVQEDEEAQEDEEVDNDAAVAGTPMELEERLRWVGKDIARLRSQAREARNEREVAQSEVSKLQIQLQQTQAQLSAAERSQQYVPIQFDALQKAAEAQISKVQEEGRAREEALADQLREVQAQLSVAHAKAANPQQHTRDGESIRKLGESSGP